MAPSYAAQAFLWMKPTTRGRALTAPECDTIDNVTSFCCCLHVMIGEIALTGCGLKVELNLVGCRSSVFLRLTQVDGAILDKLLAGPPPAGQPMRITRRPDVSDGAP